MSSQMMTAQQKVTNVRTMLEKMRPQLAMALPRHLTPDRMVRVSMTTIMRTPKLLDADITSLLGAIVTCSQLGLEPDPTLAHVHLVPFRNRKRNVIEVVVIPGYRGLMKLARNSGEIATIDAHAVFPSDTFKYSYGLKPTLHHVPDERLEHMAPEQRAVAAKAEATHYYAVAVMKNGAGQFTVLTRRQAEEHRDRFAKNVDEDSPWRSDFDAMAVKTCIRMLAKFLPASVEMQRAADLDERAEHGLPQDLGAVLDMPPLDQGNGTTREPTTPEPSPSAPAPSSKLDALVDEMTATTPPPTEPTPQSEMFKGGVVSASPPRVGERGVDTVPAPALGTPPPPVEREPFPLTDERKRAYSDLTRAAAAANVTDKDVDALARETAGTNDLNRITIADLTKITVALEKRAAAKKPPKA